MDRAQFLARWRGAAYDPLEHHCWWWASLVQRELFGRELPLAEPEQVADRSARAAALASHPARKIWREIAEPVDGALVLMARALGGVHVGVVLDGMIWHTDQPHGVVADSPLELVQSRRWRLTFLIPA